MIVMSDNSRTSSSDSHRITKNAIPKSFETLSMQHNKDDVTLDLGFAKHPPKFKKCKLKAQLERNLGLSTPQHKLFFDADKELFSVLMAAKLKRVREVAIRNQVEVWILPEDNGIRRVLVYGDCDASTSNATRELQFCTCRYAQQTLPLHDLELRTLHNLARNSGFHGA